MSLARVHSTCMLIWSLHTLVVRKWWREMGVFEDMEQFMVYCTSCIFWRDQLVMVFEHY